MVFPGQTLEFAMSWSMPRQSQAHSKTSKEPMLATPVSNLIPTFLCI
jgi:hypothetical protein